MAPEAIVLQLTYALLVAAVLAPRMTPLRILMALAAAAGLFRALAFTDDFVTAIWMGVLLAASLALLARTFLDRRRERFTDEESGMLQSLVAGVSQHRARHLMDQGLWLGGKTGDVLTREGEPVTHLYYLADGEARVMTQGRRSGPAAPAT